MSAGNRLVDAVLAEAARRDREASPLWPVAVAWAQLRVAAALLFDIVARPGPIPLPTRDLAAMLRADHARWLRLLDAVAVDEAIFDPHRGRL